MSEFDEMSKKSSGFTMSLSFRRRQQEKSQSSAQPFLAKPEKHTKRLTVPGPVQGLAPMPESAIAKAMVAATSNAENPFLKLPQEIHNAIFIHLVDQTNASRTSCVDHAGMYDLSAEKTTRHIQCSTPTLRLLLQIVLLCKQLYSEFDETLSDFRSKTVHHFRILDTEDLRAFKSFFWHPNTLHHRLTPRLKVSLPAESANLKVVLVTMSTLPDTLLRSLTLELSSPGRRHLAERPEVFMRQVYQDNRILQLGSMVCTRLSHRPFDGMWMLMYQNVRDLSEDQKNAWVEPGLSQNFDRCLWQDGRDEGMGAAVLDSTGVMEWSRSFESRKARKKTG